MPLAVWLLGLPLLPHLPADPAEEVTEHGGDDETQHGQQTKSDKCETDATGHVENVGEVFHDISLFMQKFARLWRLGECGYAGVVQFS